MQTKYSGGKHCNDDLNALHKYVLYQSLKDRGGTRPATRGCTPLFSYPITGPLWWNRLLTLVAVFCLRCRDVCCLLTQVLVWSISKGKRVATLNGHAGQIRVLRIARGGTVLLSGSDDSTVRVWNINLRVDDGACESSCLQVLRSHANSVECITTSTCGDAICSGSKDGNLHAWNLSLPSSWTLETHRTLPIKFKRVVRTWLLCVARKDCAAHLLSHQAFVLVVEIIKLIAIDCVAI